MEIKGLLMDPVSNMPVVVLRDAEHGVFLPITPRPMTHDLLKTRIGELDATVERIVINDLKDNTFFARIHLLRGDTRWDVDSRPSDAIALALRVDAEIFVEEDVLEKSKTLRPDGDDGDPERLKKWLEEVNPEDLGKYRM